MLYVCNEEHFKCVREWKCLMCDSVGMFAYNSNHVHYVLTYEYICSLSLAIYISTFSAWFPSVPLFGNPTYVVSASYINQSSELDTMCQPNGGDEEFRRGNLSGITNFRIESGPHGNIQLLPPGVGPCVYRVTVS